MFCSFKSELIIFDSKSHLALVSQLLFAVNKSRPLLYTFHSVVYGIVYSAIYSTVYRTVRSTVYLAVYSIVYNSVFF